MTSREDILAEFAMEETINHSVLRTYIAQYPELTEDLLDPFNECTMADLEAEKASMQLETKSADALTKNTQAVEAALYGMGVRQLATQLELPRSFLTGLHADVVQVSSIPGQFLKNLARAIEAKTQEVMLAMQKGGQDYAFKADQKPRVSDTMTFTDYVDQAGLSAEEQAALRRLIDDDGPR